MKIKRVLIALAAVLVMALSLMACKKEEVIVLPENAAFTLEQTQLGFYYVKTVQGGQTVFFKLPAGTKTFDYDTVGDGTHEGRVISFTTDDINIPTMYKDDVLVLRATEIPQKYTFERFKDCGYSLGIFNLTPNEGGKYPFAMTTAYLDINCDLVQKILADPNLSQQTNILLDQVDTFKVTSSRISSAGSITGLQKGREVPVDMYVGTTHFGVNAVVDTHILSSFENYETANYNFNPEGYVEIALPANLKSGYYYVNGAGLVRYVANAKADGVSDIDFNVPNQVQYDEEGNPILPDDEKKDDELSNAIEIETNVDTSMVGSEYVIEYTNESDIIYPAKPAAFLTDSEGNTKEFENNTEENKLTCSLGMIQSGKYKITLYGMEQRLFRCSIDVKTGKSDVLYHEGEGTGTILFNGGNDNGDVILTVTWANEKSLPEISVRGADDSTKKISFSESGQNVKVLDKSFGIAKLQLSGMPSGEYVLSVSGKDLGLVRMTLQNVEGESSDYEIDDTPEEETEPETERETEAPTTEPETEEETTTEEPTTEEVTEAEETEEVTEAETVKEEAE